MTPTVPRSVWTPTSAEDAEPEVSIDQHPTGQLPSVRNKYSNLPFQRGFYFCISSGSSLHLAEELTPSPD